MKHCLKLSLTPTNKTGPEASSGNGLQNLIAEITEMHDRLIHITGQSNSN